MGKLRVQGVREFTQAKSQGLTPVPSPPPHTTPNASQGVAGTSPEKRNGMFGMVKGTEEEA